MEETQVKKLKLNVTNIRSVLINSNKELRKLRLDNKNFIDLQIKKDKQKEKEKSIESKGLTTLKNFGKAILSGPLSLFDKIMEFAGVVLLGILVNNLPTIISKIEKFFSDNAWWVKGIIEIGKFIGKSVSTLADVISGTNISNVLSDREKIDSELDKIKPILSTVESEKKKLDDALKGKKQKEPSGGGTSDTKGSGSSPEGIKRAAGGPVPGKSQSQQQKSTGSGGSGSRAAESGRARRARQTTNYFGTFNQSVKIAKENTVTESDNNKLFEKLSKDLKKVFEELLDAGPHGNYGPRGPGGTSPSGPGVPVNPDEVVAYSGGVPGILSSGNSRGEHIHMENGDGYSRPGGLIPSDVLQNVLVDGKPINSYGTSRDPNTGHEGYDFQTPAGLPVTLTGGLKYVEYDAATSADTNAGFGDSLIIMDSRGKKYILAHMSGGPKNPQALLDKQNQAIQNVKNFQVKQKITGKEASWYGPGFYGNKTASGEVFTGKDYTAAMHNVPFGTRVRVTNVNNGKSVIVRINDRGPYEPDKVTPHRQRIIDLSERAAKELGVSGTAPVTIEIMEPKRGIDPNAQSYKLPDLNPPPGSEEEGSTVLVATQLVETYIPYGIPQVIEKASSTSITPPTLSALWS